MTGGLFGSLDVSASGMSAERLRMDVVAENIANANTTRDANGQPYQRKEVVLQAQGGQSFGEILDGVRVAAVANDQSPPRHVYDPGHPDANAQGYVTLPNVNPVTEMVDLISSSRGYEANVTALNTAKQMFQKALDILR